MSFTSKMQEWSRIPFWPLLAKCVLVLSLFTPIIFAILYPARKKEADAYDRAPMCAVGATDSSNCRLITDAVYVNDGCPKRNRQEDDFCEVELKVMGLKRFIGVDRKRLEMLAFGTHLRVELFQTGPTLIELDGQFVVERGSPHEAMRMLKITLAVWTVLGLIAAVYLYILKRKEQNYQR